MPAIAHAPFTVLHCRIKSMTSRSISSVKRLRGSAHGTRTCLTPCVGHWTRGISACRWV
jgi:hypothetical protein